MIKWLVNLFCKEKKAMLDMSEMINRLVLHEGLRLKPYRDSLGLLTIGIGRCIDTNPFTEEEKRAVGDWKNGITRNAAYMLCRNDIERTIGDCEKRIPFFDELDNERKYVLIDLTFNMGIKGVCKFKNMLSAMGTGNYNKAASELLNSKYASQVGKRAERLANTIKTGRFVL